VVLGGSTGGPAALAHILSLLPGDMPPIVLAQHMLDGFSASFAEQLDRVGAIRVFEAVDGAPLERGVALVAPAGSQTRITAGAGLSLALEVVSPSAQDIHRPSIDVLFHSAAAAVGARALGVILTGMGRDGAEGLLAMRLAGAMTFAQDEASSAVFGMPARAIEIGAVQHVADLPDLAAALVDATRVRSGTTH